MISAKYSGPAKNVVAKLFKYAEEETNRYLVLSVNMWQVETLNEPNFDH